MWRGTHDVTKKQRASKSEIGMLLPIDQFFLSSSASAGDLYCIFLLIILSLKSLWQIRCNSVLIFILWPNWRKNRTAASFSSILRFFWRQHSKVICIGNFLGVSHRWNICCRISLMANLFHSEFLQRIASDRGDLNCPVGSILLADISLFIDYEQGLEKLFWSLNPLA